LKVNDVVILKIDLPEENLEKGMRGTIVSLFEIPDLAYDVEFCDEGGRTIAEVALKCSQIEIVKN